MIEQIGYLSGYNIYNATSCLVTVKGIDPTDLQGPLILVGILLAIYFMTFFILVAYATEEKKFKKFLRAKKLIQQYVEWKEEQR